MSTVAAPADRRFRRVHIKPGRRRRGPAAWLRPIVGYGVLVLILTAAFYRVSTISAHAGLLQVDRILVRGNRRLSRGEVLAVLSGLRGESLLWTDLDRWRRRLLASPWIQDATLRRSLPSTIEVTVVEREPVGIGRIGGEMYLVDDRGSIIDQFGPEYADLDLPIIDGLASASGSEAGDERAGLASRVLGSLGASPAVARRVSQLDVSDAHNAKVILNGDPAVIELGDDEFLQRLQSYLDVASALRDRVPEIDYVDVRFDGRIYVRPLAEPKGNRR